LSCLKGHIYEYLQGHERLMLNYFAESPIYPLRLFRRKFRMRRPLFLRIVSKVEDYEPYFVQEKNAAGILDFSSFKRLPLHSRC
jgi:hypothetical protein